MMRDLERFLAGARWFGGKGREFQVTGVRRAGVLPALDVPGLETAPGVAIDLVEVTYGSSGNGEGGEDTADTELYQVPLAFHTTPQERLSHAFVGSWDDPDFGDSHAYDAVHDRDAMALWLHAFSREASGRGDHSQSLAFHRLEGHEIDLTVHSTLFSGEQSNSSVAFGEDSLMKVFRKVTPGVNPDIQVHDVLTRAGSDHVAALYGWLDTVDEASDAVIQLALLQQFLRTASDGWELALASVRNLFTETDLHADEVGGDFAGEATRLGVALAETHATLAHEFPVEHIDPAAPGGPGPAMRRRLAEAASTVPDLAPYADRLAAIHDALAARGTLEVQRIHADLHLGQTLRTVRGWKLVDFEGEPARPLAERLLPDSVWRDVAGMLRSFDYAAAVVERSMLKNDDEPPELRAARASEWTARNRSAFLDAYAEAGQVPVDRVALAAYEADKAVYECLYEARNRPSWLPIPLTALRRLVR